MKKYVFVAIAVIAVTAVTLSLNAQPAGGGGGMGGFGGGAGGGFGGGGFGGGMMGGGRGARGPVVRPDKAARLASIAELEKQVATLKAAVEKAPDKDTEVTPESDEATMQKAMYAARVICDIAHERHLVGFFMSSHCLEPLFKT